MKLPVMPRNLTRVKEDEKFSFACHKSVRCFTHCCRKLELALTPYDVLRMKNGLKISSAEFLEKYVIVEHDNDDIFPRLYLSMVDDGNESCVFVTPQGCSIYNDRPGACRAYPMGRAAMRQEGDSLEEHFVLLKEDHCKGFQESAQQTPLEYSNQQGLNTYNEMNDAMAVITQHEKIREGMQLTTQQINYYILALYDLDTFRKRLFAHNKLDDPRVAELEKELEDDVKLLFFGIKWLHSRLFSTS